MKNSNNVSFSVLHGFCAWMALSGLAACADAGPAEADLEREIGGPEVLGDVDEVRADNGAAVSSAALMAERVETCLTNRETTSYSEMSEMLSCIQDVNMRGARTVDGRLRAMPGVDAEAREVEQTHLTKYRQAWASLCDRVAPIYDPSDPEALAMRVANARCVLDSEVGLAIGLVRVGLGGETSLLRSQNWADTAFRPEHCTESVFEDLRVAVGNTEKRIAIESFVYCADDAILQIAEIRDSAIQPTISEPVDSILGERLGLCDRLAHAHSYVSLQSMEEPARQNLLAWQRVTCARTLQAPLAQTMASVNE